MFENTRYRGTIPEKKGYHLFPHTEYYRSTLGALKENPLQDWQKGIEGLWQYYTYMEKLKSQIRQWNHHHK